MTFNVEEREKAIRPCDFEKQGNKNQCLNCIFSKETEDNVYMGRDCIQWCVIVEYDDFCSKHQLIN